MPDTVGYATPDELREFFADVIARVPNADKAMFSAHCHNDLGLAVANSLAFEEIPVQVDERYFYCLSNPGSSFAFYSGTDKELTYAWDVESWKMTGGVCAKEYAPGDGPIPGTKWPGSNADCSTSAK